MKYRPCKLSDLLNVERHNQIKRYSVSEDGWPMQEFDEDWSNNHGYDEKSDEYECTNLHQDIMTEDRFDNWEDATHHLRDYGEENRDDSDPQTPVLQLA